MLPSPLFLGPVSRGSRGRSLDSPLSNTQSRSSAARLRLLIVNSQPLHLHPEGWRGEGWQDFANSIASCFESAVLWVPAILDGGERYDILPMSSVRVEPAPFGKTFWGLLRGLVNFGVTSTLRQLAALVKRHDIVLLRVPSP